MKIRIKGNSVRLRLSKSDVEKFIAEGELKENTCFANGLFSYALNCKVGSDGEELSADFVNGIITMHIPEKLVRQWLEPNIVGFDTWMTLNNGDKLYLLLEKDFRCLDETVKDQSDNYENPLAPK